jgi:hypothetical protein
MQEAKPAPKSEQKEGSDKNKPGSAAGPGGDITLSKEVEQSLRNKVKEHNDKMKDDDKPDWARTTYGQLAAVYRRGAGAYSSSHRPGQTRGAWAMARVNAYLYLLQNGRPKNPKYITDYDLLPKNHPKSSRNNNSVLNEYTTEVKLVDNLQEKIDFTIEDSINDSFEEALGIVDIESEEATSAATESEVAKVDIDMKEKDDKAKAAKKDKMAGHDDDEKKMAEHDDDDDKDKMAEHDDDDDKDKMAEHDDDDKKKMAEHDDEKKDKNGMEKDKKEYQSMESDEIIAPTDNIELATSNEDDKHAEEAKENSDASFTESERQELERFRREEKQKVLNSYKQFLSEEVYEEFSQTLDQLTRESLEKELKLKVADYFMAQAAEMEQAKELESKKEFKTLQVLDQLRDKDVASDIAKLVDKYKK